VWEGIEAVAKAMKRKQLQVHCLVRAGAASSFSKSLGVFCLKLKFQRANI
jgi:hypothetical protein